MTAKMFLLYGISPYDPLLKEELLAYIPYYPSQYNWYAYPPLPLFIFSLGYLLYMIFSKLTGIEGLLFERFFVGLVISLGDILLAYFSYKLGIEISGQNKAEKIERAILFNPFIIFVSSLWGMIDSWSAAFLVGSIYFIVKRENKKAAIFFGLSALVKQLTILLAPLFLAYLIKKSSIKDLLMFIITSVSTFLFVSFPFLMMHPNNFIYQVFMFHIGRPPQGVSLPSIIYLGLSSLAYQQTYGFMAIDMISSIITFISFVVMIVVLLWIAIKYLSIDENDNIFFLQAFVLSLLVILFLNKVSNPQYFVLLAGVGIVYGYSMPEKSSIDRINSILYMVMSLMILTTIGGINFLWLPKYSKLTIMRTLWCIFIRKDTITYTPTIIMISIFSILITVKLCWLFIETLYMESMASKISFLHPPRAWRAELIYRMRSISKRIITSVESNLRISVVCIILVCVVGGLLAGRISKEKSTTTMNMNHPTSNKLVGIFYEWYINPTHDRETPGGPWENAKLRPVDGYYDSSLVRLEKDIEVFKDLGIDFIVIDVTSMGALLSEQVVDKLIESNLSVCIMINLTDLLYDPMVPKVVYKNDTSNIRERYLELVPDNIQLVRNQINNVMDRFSNLENNLQVGNNSAIIISGIQRFMPGWRYESKSYLASSLIEMYEDRYDTENISLVLDIIRNDTGWNATSVDDLIDEYYPPNISQLISNGSYNVWIEAFRYAWNRDILGLLPQNVSIIMGYECLPLCLIDRETLENVSISVFPYPNRYIMFDGYEFIEKQERNLEEGKSNLVISVPNYIYDRNMRILINESPMYNETWRIATCNNVDIVIIFGWNIYSTGSVIEPTYEFGNKTLSITKVKIKIYKGGEIQFRFLGIQKAHKMEAMITKREEECM